MSTTFIKECSVGVAFKQTDENGLERTLMLYFHLCAGQAIQISCPTCI